MRDFSGRTAVVTGAASGIGNGLATALAEQGARVVLADVEAERLEEAAARLRASGAEALGVVTDVSDQASVDALAERAYAEMGEVHVLCNNAGVFTGSFSWEATDDDWDWVFGVNVWGIVHGIRAFVPRMLERGTEGHVINTASIAGMIGSPMSTVYCTSKFAAVGLSECLHHDLQMQEGARIGVSVITPGLVGTDIARAERNRPAELGKRTDTESARNVAAATVEFTAKGPDPLEVARRVLGQVKEGRFYVSTNDAYAGHVGIHNEDRLAQRPPTFQMYE